MYVYTGISNPNFGVTSFDNILAGFVTILQCISLEGWSDVLYLTEEVFISLSLSLSLDMTNLENLSYS